jgi:hypothetical protein
MTPLKRAVIGCLAVAAALLLLVLGAILSAPLWIDSDAVKREIAQQVQRATGDTIELERLRMRMFPPIGVTVTGPRYRIADLADIEAQSADIDLSLLALLSGRVQPRSVAFSGVRATVRIPPPDGAGKPVTLQQVDAQLRQAIGQIVEAVPGMRITIGDAVVTILRPGEAPFELRKLELDAKVSAHAIDAELQCASGLWERLEVEASLATDLSGHGRAALVGFDAAGLAALLGLTDGWTLAEARLIGRVDWRMRGLESVQVQAVASSPRVTLRQGGREQAFSGATAAATLQTRGRAFEARVERLYVAEPNVLVGGGFARDERGRYAFDLDGGGARLLDVLAVARNFAPDVDWLAKPPIDLREGSVTSITLRSSAEDPDDLFDLALLQGEAALDGVAFGLRRPKLEFSGVSGRVALAQGELQVRNAAATLGRSRLSNGRMNLPLGDNPRMSIDGLVEVDLADALAVARTVITRKDVRAHLDDIESLDGRALAQVSLQGRPQDLRPTVGLSGLELSLIHRRVPLPVRLSGGSFRYSSTAVALRDAAGSIGSSTFAALDASLGLDAPHEFSVSQHGARLNLEQLLATARKIPAAAPYTEKVRTLSGTLVVPEAQAAGSLQAPEASRFRAVLEPHGVKLLLAALDTDVLLDGGSIAVSDAAIEAHDVGVVTEDSSLRVSAKTGRYADGLKEFEVQAKGDVGAGTIERVNRAASLPPTLQLRAPLRIADSQTSWKATGDVSFQGTVNVAGTTDLDISASSAAGKTRMDRLAVKDAWSDARLSGELAGDNMAVKMKGLLDGRTLAAVFVQPALAMDRLQGDADVGIHFAHPWITHAQGTLKGNRIAIPNLPEHPVMIEHADLSMGGGRIKVLDALVSIDGNSVAMKGEVWRDDRKLGIDADLKSDRIVLPASATEDDGQDTALDLDALPVTGRIGIDFGRLETKRASLVPLVAEARLEGNRLDLRIERASLCEITMAGTLKGPLSDLELNGSLSARETDLAKTIGCLTSSRIVGSGNLTLDAQMSARGEFDQLGSRMQGSFSAVSRDGRIEKFDTLNRVFSYLNITEKVRGKQVSSKGGGLPYRTITTKGSLDGRVVKLDEVVMDAQTVHIVATGQVDYDTSKVSMDVLVAPLQTANAVLNKIPILSNIFGGTVLALPVQVLGTVENPLVVPLGPGAVVNRMTSIVANTLRLPLDAVKMVTPSGSTSPHPEQK